ncbi:MAG: hypothetical protein ACOX51_02670 [Myxococcota bacterium]|jgi:hypothetical protein|nr:hypothetical protein [Myxococcota bacterium]MBP8970391.1 hypothetical protein [Myxococcota bacterium]OQC41373.1 MAG: hypothetical protein BWX66_00749 [Deltaproteobacteria bacterium ADurb.Bin058]HHW97951.1 hypothetical protein [Oligoflexales bacterium]HQL56893.1 hypothetical protein [Myxococcota bacterium]
MKARSITMCWFGAFLLVQLGCQAEEEALGPVPETNYVMVETETASMAPAIGLCYYVQQYSEYRGLPGFSFVGRVESVLDGDELAQFRDENCFEGFTGCSYYPVVNVSVEDMLMGDLPTGGHTQVMIAPLRAEEVSKWYPGKRVLIFARNFNDLGNEAGLTNFHATFILDDGYAFATSAEGLKHDFGTSAVTENELLARVGELKKADPTECPWDQDGKLKNEPTTSPAPDSTNSEYTSGPRY